MAGATINVSGNYDILLKKYAPTGQLVWTVQFDGAGNGDDYAGDIIIDASQNVFLTGSSYYSSTRINDLVILKIATNGVVSWSKYHDGNNLDDAGTALTFDDMGNVCVSGTTMNSTTNSDFLIKSYDYSGNVNWSTTWNYINLIDISNNINFANGELLVSGGAETGGGAWDIALVTLDPTSGSYINSSITGGTGSGVDEITDIEVDGNGFYYVCGTIVNTSTGNDFYLMKLDSDLVVLWSQSFNSAGSMSDEAKGIGLDDNGNIYVTGYSEAATGGTMFQTLKYTNNGTFTWQQSFQSQVNAIDEANDVVLLNNNPVITGTISNDLGTDIYSIKYDALGNIIWQIGFNDQLNGSNYANDIAVDINDNIIINGTTELNNIYTNLNIKYSEKEIYADANLPYASGMYSIIKNNGQILGTDALPANNVDFMINNLPYSVFLGQGVLHYSYLIEGDTLTPDTINRVDIKFQSTAETGTAAKPEPIDIRSEFSNYYLEHLPEGRERVPHFNKVYYNEVQAGKDLMVTTNAMGMSYNFVVKPGVTNAVTFYVYGQSNISIDTHGDLIISSSLGDIVLPKPVAHERDANGNDISLGWAPTYSVQGNKVTINTSSYNTSNSLIINIQSSPSTLPTFTGLCWGSYLGGNQSEEALATHVDNVGNHFVSGYTSSSNNTFPIYNAAQQITTGKSSFVSKFDKGGNSFIKHELRWSTYFGNGEASTAYDVKTNSNGDVYICGGSEWIQTKIQIGATNNSASTATGTNHNAYIAKFNSNSGNVDWATYFGDAGNEDFFSMAFDGDDNLYLGGMGYGGNYTANLSGAYNQSYTTATSSDGLLAKFNSSDALVWCTFYGGNSTDHIASVEIDGNNNVVIAGLTVSTNLPVFDANTSSSLDYYKPSLTGSNDVFIVKFNSAGVRQWGTYFGGDDTDWGCCGYSKNMLAFDNNNNLYIVGTTESDNLSENFPIQATGYTGYSFNDNTFAGTDGFITRFNPSFQLDWSTYVSVNGGTQLTAIDIDDVGKIFIGGSTRDAGLGFIQSNNLYYQSSIKVSPSSLTFQDAFIMAMDYDHFLTWMTPIGGLVSAGWSYGEEILDLEISGSTELFVSGRTTSDGGSPYSANDNFPTFDYDQNSTSDYYVYQNQGPYNDGFIISFCVESLIYTSVDDSPSLNNDLTIYPNPAKNQLNIRANSSEIQSIEIYDIIGKLIKSINTQFRKFIVVDISLLVPGTYTISVQTKNNTIHEKFIKQ